MYNLSKNNFYKCEKNSVVYTPESIAKQLKNILIKEFKNKNFKNLLVFDPCVGSGNLLKPWEEEGFQVIGFDLTEQGFPNTKIHNYLELEKNNINFKPDIVVINPPFNFNNSMKQNSVELGFSSRPLIPEVFLFKTLELFGRDQKIALFTPYGLRLNNSSDSIRIQRFLNKNYPEITGIISLPKDIYEGVQFHSEILLFNTKKNKPHYFLIKKEGT